MNKFYKLENYLRATKEDSFVLSFEEIEDILGFMLSDSAYFYSAYWTPSKTHTLANLIDDCGFKTDVNRVRQTVSFRRLYRGPQSITKAAEKTSINLANKPIRVKKAYQVSIAQCVNKFTHIYKLDHNGRYMSYDHIRECFLKYRKDPSKRDLITLHLYAYLASWGMLRNSFLMQKDYLFSRPVVDILCSDKYDSLLDFNPFEKVNVNDINLIIDLSFSIKKYYMKHSYYGEGDKGRQPITNVTDTLITKIILGTFGCTVAYDKYVKLGLSSLNMSQGLTKQSIMELCEFAKANEEEIKKEIEYLNALYTPMKIIDMYFFEKGFEIEKK